MAYLKDQIVYPATVGEALAQYLDAQLPLEHGGDLAHGFFEHLQAMGIAAQSLRDIKIAPPEGAVPIDF